MTNYETTLTDSPCKSAVSFLFLEESLHTRQNRKRRRGGQSDEEDNVTTVLETEDSSGSLQSTDSGIEMTKGTELQRAGDSDVELIDIMQSEMDNDDLIMVESDIDTDSEFERVNSDAELLLEEHDNVKLVHGQTTSRSPNSSRLCHPACLAAQFGPRQFYASVRNSLMDTYGCIVWCVKCLKSCCSCHRKRWTVNGQSNENPARRLRRFVVNLVRLVLDRKVFVSTLLYGLLAFLAIICQEVCMLMLLVADAETI